MSSKKNESPDDQEERKRPDYVDEDAKRRLQDSPEGVPNYSD